MISSATDSLVELAVNTGRGGGGGGAGITTSALDSFNNEVESAIFCPSGTPSLLSQPESFSVEHRAGEPGSGRAAAGEALKVWDSSTPECVEEFVKKKTEILKKCKEKNVHL